MRKFSAKDNIISSGSLEVETKVKKNPLMKVTILLVIFLLGVLLLLLTLYFRNPAKYSEVDLLNRIPFSKNADINIISGTFVAGDEEQLAVKIRLENGDAYIMQIDKSVSVFNKKTRKKVSYTVAYDLSTNSKIGFIETSEAKYSEIPFIFNGETIQKVKVYLPNSIKEFYVY